jgi:hypothetical protein
MTYDPEDPDRPRGLLAPVDRKFLIGEKKYDHRQSAYNRREEIRERVENGFLDFCTLAEEMDLTERAKIFGAQRPREERAVLEDGIADLIRFLYLGLGRSRFEQVLREGVQNAEVDLGTAEIPQTTRVELTVDPQQDYSLEETVRHIESQEWHKIDPGGAVGFLQFANQAPDFDATQILDQIHALGEGAHRDDSSDTEG